MRNNSLRKVLLTSSHLNGSFTSNGKREFVPRDQVSLLLVFYCSLFQPIN